MSNQFLLIVLLLVPLFGAVLSFCSPRKYSGYVATVACAVLHARAQMEGISLNSSSIGFSKNPMNGDLYSLPSSELKLVDQLLDGSAECETGTIAFNGGGKFAIGTLSPGIMTGVLWTGVIPIGEKAQGVEQ